MRKNFRFILFVVFVLALGIFITSCSSSDKSPLDLYVSDVSYGVYSVSAANAMPVSVELRCTYLSTTTQTNVSGVFINYYTFTPEDENGNVLSGPPSRKTRESIFIDKNSNHIFQWSDFVGDWPDLKKYCDSNTAGGRITYHIHFVGEDSSGNSVSADAYFPFTWTQ